MPGCPSAFTAPLQRGPRKSLKQGPYGGTHNEGLHLRRRRDRRLFGRATCSGRRRGQPRGARRAPRGDAQERRAAPQRTTRKSSRIRPARTIPPNSGSQDCVIVGLKGHQLSGAVELMQPLLGNDTAIVTAVNGIPYWYFYKHGGKHEGARWRASIPAAGSGRGCVPSAPSAASFTRRRKSSSRASSGTSTATSFRSASRRASGPSASRRSRACSRRPGSRRRCSTTSATRSG